jgi:O-antigen/teichoic acid export membrane protein
LYSDGKCDKNNMMDEKRQKDSEAMIMKKSLVTKFMSFSYGSWASLGIGLLSTIVLTRLLDPVQFGKAAMFELLINVLMIFAILGTDQAFIRFFYEEEKEKRAYLFWSCMKIPIKMILAIGVIVFFWGESIQRFFFEEASFMISGWIIAGFTLKVLHRYGTVILRMKQEGHRFSMIQILERLFLILFAITFYSVFGNRFQVLIYSTVASVALMVFFLILYNPEFVFIKKPTTAKHSGKEIMSYSVPLMMTILMTWVFQSIDRMSIKFWGSFEELGVYVAAFKIIALINVLQISFTTFWTPVAFEHFQNWPTDKAFYQNMFYVVSWGMFLVCVGTILFKDVILLILGQQYVGASSIVPLLVFIPLMYTMSEITSVGIQFFKKPKVHLLISAMTCLINGVGNYLLVPSYGAQGAAFSTAVSYLAFFVLRTMASQRWYKVNFGLWKTYTLVALLFIYAWLASLIDHAHILMGGAVLWIFIFGIIYWKELTSWKTIKKTFTSWVE